MSDLKPCPFCGAPAVHLKPPDSSPDGWVGCGVCSIGIRYNDTSLGSSKRVDIETWNRRAHDATETAALRKVRDLADDPTIAWPDKRDLILVELDAILKERE